MTTPRKGAGRQPNDKPDEAAKGDRHKPYWGVRLGLRHKAAILAFKAKFEAEQGVEVDAFALVRAAVEEYCARRGTWPPPEQAAKG